MPIFKVETPERYSPEDANHLSEELARLRAKRIGDAAPELGSRVMSASTIGERVVRASTELPGVGMEQSITVPERTVDNFWLHKPA